MSGKHVVWKAVAAALLIAAAAPASAGDGWSSSTRGFGHQHHQRFGPTVGYTTPVTRVAGVGTFSRSVWVLNRDHMGTSATPPLAPRAKIIDVDSAMRSGSTSPSSACSYEAGVCVIRSTY